MLFLAKSERQRNAETYKIEQVPSTVYGDSYFACECLHYVYRLHKIKGECKHIRAWRELGLMNNGELDQDTLIKLIFQGDENEKRY